MLAACWCAAPATPVLFTTRAEATWLVLLPLNKLLASTPFSKKSIAGVALAIGPDRLLPRPALAPVPLGSSALTPGERIASPVKLPVGRGIDFNLRFFQNVAVGRIHGIHERRFFHRDRGATWPIFKRAFTVAVRLACTRIDGTFWVLNPSCVKVSV